LFHRFVSTPTAPNTIHNYKSSIMKPRMLSASRLSLPLATAIASMLALPATQAATSIKADNADDLNLASSWDTLPGPADIARWNDTVTTANSTLLGANLSWDGIEITNVGITPGSEPVTIGGSDTLTIGKSGIDMSFADQDLTISCGLKVFGKQNWLAAPGRTLDVAGTFTRNGATVDFTSFDATATLGTLTNDASGILGPWAVSGTTTSLQYVASTAGAISAYTGATAAAADLTDVSSTTTNYTYGAAVTLAGNQTGNTLRYTGGATTTALGTNSLTLNGLMHAGNGTLIVTSTAGNPGLVIGASDELDIISNDKDIQLKTRITGSSMGKVVYNAGAAITFGAASDPGSTNNYGGGTVINGASLFTLVGPGTWFGTGPVTINGGTMFFSNNTLANDFTFNGGLATMNNSSLSTLNGTITLAVPTTFQLNQNGNMTINGKVTGPGGLTKTQGTANAPLNLANANNDYAGPTSVTGGVLLASSLYGNDTAKWTPANISVDSGATFGLNVGGASDFSTTNAGTMLTNLLTVNNNGLKHGSFFGLSTANAAGTVTFSTALTNSTGPGSGVVGFRKIGAGTLELSGPNTYTGKTIINLGELKVSSLNSVNGGSPPMASSSLGRPITVANGTIEFSAPTSATGNSTTSLIYTGSGETTDRVINLISQLLGGILDQSGTGLLKFTSNLLVPGVASRDCRKTLTLQGSTAGTGEISGIIPDSALGNANQKTTSLAKSGTGTWILSGPNTYTGTTTINGGALQAIDGTGLPSTNLLQLRGGVFQSSGTFSRAVSTTAPAVNWGTGSGGFAAKGAPLTLNLNSGTASLTWNGSSMVQDGQTLIFGSTTADNLVDFQNGLNLGSGLVLTRTITVNDNPDSTADIARISGAITNTTAGMSLLKDGAGTLELTNANTYSGTTTVGAGTLRVNNTTGSGTGSGAVNVTTGTLGGAGTITGAVTLGNADGSADAILAPGNSIGTIATGDLTFDSDGSYACELNGTSATSDRANVTGAVAINAATTLTVSLSGSLAGGQRYFIVVNDDVEGVTGTFASLPQDAVVGTFGGTELKISYTGDSGSAAPNNITGGNDIVLYTEGSALTPYESWALGPFTNSFTNTLPGVDFDNDGLSNLLEFVLGGDPTISQDDIAPTAIVSGGNLELKFNRSDASELAPAVTVTVELSADLTFTTPADDITIGPASDLGPIAPSGASYTVVNSGGSDTITVSIPQGAAPRKFARVKAIQP
jgi:autotransporter-associated beta strand protein